MNDFSRILKDLRQRENLSQDAVARRLGIARTTYASYEQGRRQPSFEIEEKIANFYNVDINTLRGYPEQNLNEEEAFIINSYQRLNNNARERLLAYVRILSDLQKGGNDGD